MPSNAARISDHFEADASLNQPRAGRSFPSSFVKSDPNGSAVKWPWALAGSKARAIRSGKLLRDRAGIS